MRSGSRIIHLCLLTLTVFALGLPASTDPREGSTDNAESRTLVLANGLQVVLLSDPDLNISSAAMSVGVGSFADSDDALGIVHFLEHMLFLGTEKFPNEAEYGAYLRQNGGYSNAYTSSSHTNYHFEVYDDAFEGALDRFAQFFIAPLFTEEFTEREMNAVHSEYQKNLEDDNWRIQSLYQALGREGHPRTRFSIGSLETLQNVSRETLIAFYNEYYSANQMALSLVSSLPLDVMEEWVHQYFSEIPNHNIERPQYPADFIQSGESFRFARIRPIQERRNLNLIFNLPSIEKDWDAKTSSLIGHILGYEGAGSLLSSLKEAGLAVGLGASIWDPSPEYALLYISVDLTQQGLAEYERVAQHVLGYLEMLRQKEFPDYIYEELRQMAQLENLYGDKGEGTQRALGLANNAYFLPLEHAVEAPYVFARKDEDFYYTLLDHARPQNMLMLLVARDLETDTTDPWFGTDYSVETVQGERFQGFVQVEVPAEFTLPAPNPFIPTQVEYLAERPVKLIERPDLTLFYGQDTTFERPQVSMAFRFRPRWETIDARTAALLDLYAATFYEAVNEIGYAAGSAGASYRLNTAFDGITLSVAGYTGSVEALVEELVPALRSFEISETQFAAVQDRLRRAWESEVFGNAFQFIREYQIQMMLEHHFRAPQKAAAAVDITLDDVLAFRDTLFSQGRVDALIYGNVTADQARAEAETVVDALNFETIPDDQTYKTKVLVLEPGEEVLAEEVLPSNNSVFRRDIIVGSDAPRERMLLSILSNLIQSPYYSEMRTRQQLGYVVATAPFTREHELNLMFLIQSGEYDPVELRQRSDALVETFPEMLAGMPPEAFNEARNAVRSQLLEKPTNVAQKAEILAARAFDYNEDWDRRADALDALDSLTREDLIAFLENLLDPTQSRSRITYFYARQHAEIAEQVEGVTDILNWKQRRTYQPVP